MIAVALAAAVTVAAAVDSAAVAVAVVNQIPADAITSCK